MILKRSGFCLLVTVVTTVALIVGMLISYVMLGGIIE